MKAKKVLKRLTNVEDLLSNVIDQYTEGEKDVRDLLDGARASVARAKKAVAEVKHSSKTPKKAPSKAESSKRGLTAGGRKRLSVAAKKRWAAAKRKGISAVTGRPLSKTA